MKTPWLSQAFENHRLHASPDILGDLLQNSVDNDGLGWKLAKTMQWTTGKHVATNGRLMMKDVGEGMKHDRHTTVDLDGLSFTSFVPRLCTPVFASPLSIF